MSVVIVTELSTKDQIPRSIAWKYRRTLHYKSSDGISIYFEDFDQLVIRVEATMQYFSERADDVMKVFGKFKKLEAASAKA